MKGETKVVALTGSVGTGKSTVAWMFGELGVPVIDADEIAHEALAHQKTKAALFERFGKDAIGKDGVVDRDAVAAKVFGDPKERKFLESLIHPFVRNEIEKRVAKFAKEKAPLVVVEIPLLFEVGWEKDFDSVVVVRCSERNETRRCMKKFGWTEAEVKRRIAAQFPLERKVAGADHVIENDGPIEETKVQVGRLYQKLLSLL